MVEKELDAIRELQGEADGANNSTIIPALLDKVAHPEAEVRKAALAALVQLNDTNAVPGLEQAAELMKDPRAKVAVLDTIDYLKLPGITPEVPPDDFTNNNNRATRPRPAMKVNPNFQHGGRNNGRQAAQPAVTTDQPQ